MKNQIYDCITFYNANLLFEMRFHTLKNVVDYFVVCEANKDHMGNYKGYNFRPKISEHDKKKIIYIQVDDLPSIKIKGKKDYKLLSIQMENLFKGIEKANNDDLIIFSDEDEIPNPEIINSFNESKFKFGILLQNMYYYKLNIMSIDEGNGNWPGSRMCLKKNLKSFFQFRLLKIKNTEYPFWRIDKEKSIQLIKSGGWHFTYLMSPKEIIKKIESMAHSEFNKEEFKKEHMVESNINNLKDPFGRDLRLARVEIENSFPKYLRDNIDLYKDWILK
jgi:beta-1,4-mannosyl-glycoprotein beta-1,4-N-acetylglucosaminyltransferase